MFAHRNDLTPVQAQYILDHAIAATSADIAASIELQDKELRDECSNLQAIRKRMDVQGILTKTARQCFILSYVQACEQFGQSEALVLTLRGIVAAGGIGK